MHQIKGKDKFKIYFLGKSPSGRLRYELVNVMTKSKIKFYMLSSKDIIYITSYPNYEDFDNMFNYIEEIAKNWHIEKIVVLDYGNELRKFLELRSYKPIIFNLKEVLCKEVRNEKWKSQRGI